LACKALEPTITAHTRSTQFLERGGGVHCCSAKVVISPKWRALTLTLIFQEFSPALSVVISTVAMDSKALACLVVFYQPQADTPDAPLPPTSSRAASPKEETLFEMVDPILRDRENRAGSVRQVGEISVEKETRSRVVYGANHRTGRRPGETGPPRPFYAAQSGLIPALKASRMTTPSNPFRSDIHMLNDNIKRAHQTGHLLAPIILRTHTTSLGVQLQFFVTLTRVQLTRLPT
jgi:hypothetical protein